MNATEVKTYRGRTLEEVLPKIKAELGPDAEIVRQRSGLTGGVGGFFQRSMVEVEARPSEGPQVAGRRPQGRRFDAYDDSPAVPEPYTPEPEPEAFVPDEVPRTPTAEGLSAPGIQEILRQAAPFADALDAASEELAPAQEPAPPATRDLRPATPIEPTPQLPANAVALESALKDAGLDADFAQELVQEVVDHELPFASPRSLKRLVRRALARRIPVAPAAPAGARSVAFAGPGGAGKTLLSARLAAAYARGSELPVVVIALRSPDGGAELRALLEPLGIGVRAADSGDEARAHLAGAVHHAVVVVDTPAVAPRSAAEVAALSAELRALGVGEVHLALPSTYSGPAARELTDLLAPLEPSRIALTHMDATTHVGGLLDYAIREDRPISYVSEGTGVPGGLEPADAEALAALVLP
ncbi:MAG: flagellar biosynthesis protein FlhF [Thermoleophilaceae bacterium]|jgi:flagellar biosynthesis GTPase FlhF|nr:flagellar biosynthesis protein FlhF [Thermoleophilaceae bacterium]